MQLNKDATYKILGSTLIIDIDSEIKTATLTVLLILRRGEVLLCISQKLKRANILNSRKGFVLDRKLYYCRRKDFF